MVVKCIRNSITDNNSNNPYIINNNLKEYIKVGDEFVVYGIRIAKAANYFMIFDDTHLLEVPSQMFDIIDGQVSPLWIAHYDSFNDLCFWPAIFYEDDFLENFSEWEDKERKRFEEFRQLFEKSSD